MNKRKTILFLVKFIPAPAYDGGALRNGVWLKFLLKKYNVILVGFWNKKYGQQMISSLCSNNLEVCGEYLSEGVFRKVFLFVKMLFFKKSFIISKYYNNKIKIKVKRIIEERKPDFILCSELSTMQHINEEKGLNPPIYFDDHNVEFKLLERISQNSNNLFKKIIFKKESNFIRKFEAKAVNRAKQVFTVSEQDRYLLSSEFNLPLKKLRVVSNVFEDKGGFKGKLSGNPTLVFMGNLNWLPNKQGLLYFLNSIFPQIIKELPKVKFNIIGSNSPQEIIRKSVNMPIIFWRDVDEAVKNKVINESWVGIIPLYFASGSRIKILELWSHGKGVVTTKIGLEGLSHPNGTFIINSDIEFTNKIIELLTNKNKLEILGGNNYKLFKSFYLFEKVYGNSLYNSFSA